MTDNSILTRTIGGSGISASAVGLGTWAIGGWMWGGTDERQSIAAIQASIDAGISLIDTAPAYGMGLAETIVGKAIAGRRDKVVLVTKCGLVWHVNEGAYFFHQDGKPVHRYLGAASIRHEVEESLKRLGTDYIDHYVTHWQDATTPIAETVETLVRLKDEGKIRSIGASNVSPEDLVAYIATGALDAIQEEYSMVRRDIETTLLPLCRTSAVSVLSYSSLALGLLSGKVGPERVFAGDDQRKGNPRFSQANREKIARLTRRLEPVAEAHGASIAQVVIAWTIAQPGITFSLCGARDPAQAVENAAAARLRLAENELALISVGVAEHLVGLDA
ncbi:MULTISPECIES: aldo/keto reductase [Rhizobium/Agrobacterium group]|uniref:Aldo/keto reductase n=1 Tax=Agrobacterium tumefaciens TaxID=358 RepID=A0AAJ4N5Z6_AGRTU|nr:MULTISPECIES: aldo/keto reductase [Rhizobium/Agrobacterium group]MEA1842854.1 aldo/keto reductase [Agrobacterium tumefaciens]NTA44311.1 aldo/keto reductase [Agrobacterium tumefaciens]NTA82773.1 aldo/keto reductase [Agrobacterium tumefaciens]QTG15396.1 aldo/keto reductase [Agrobacterium tumefaciens]TWC80024.1 aryl-alcohol dehydrogenase-like predicted oxidoreductase [Rhizobium sp. SJZ105]